MRQFFERCRKTGESWIAAVAGTGADKRAQALMEAALAIPVFLLLLVGVTEFSFASYDSIEVTNAAFAGAQYGAQNTNTAADTTGISNAAQNDAGNRTLGTTTSSVSCTCSNSTSSVTCVSTSCPGSNLETILTVQTQATFNTGFHVPGVASSFTVHGLAVQKVLQ